MAHFNGAPQSLSQREMALLVLGANSATAASIEAIRWARAVDDETTKWWNERA